jgi:hypothetical protein
MHGCRRRETGQEGWLLQWKAKDGLTKQPIMRWLNPSPSIQASRPMAILEATAVTARFSTQNGGEIRYSGKAVRDPIKGLRKNISGEYLNYRQTPLW